MEQESDFVPNEFDRRVNGGIDRLSQLPDEILFVILSFLRFKEAAATTVLSSRWLDLWKHNPHIKFDRISQLPDEILLVILSFLKLREAAATSVLSSRWSDVWKHTPKLEFDQYILTPTSDWDNFDGDDDLVEAERCKNVGRITSIIQLHKALSLKKLRISLRVRKSDNCAVTKWLKFVFSRPVESLELNFEFFATLNSVVLEELLKDESIITRAPETLLFFQSLKTLRLTSLIVSGEDMDLFLQNCPLLEQLTIGNLFLTSDVQLCGANLMLRHLEIFSCDGQKSIKVSAPNLTWISFDSRGALSSIENVPKLVEADITVCGSRFDIQHFTSVVSCYRSQLQSLKLIIVSRPKFLMRGIPQMPNLKKLVIYHRKVYGHSLLPIAAVIWEFPRLEEFKLEYHGRDFDDNAWMGALTNVERSSHQHLKVFAFRASYRRYMGISDHVVELVSYILDNCVALQKIIIGSPFYDEVYSGKRERCCIVTAKMQADADNLMQQLQDKVKTLVENLEKSGCKIETDLIEAVVNNEDKKYSGVYFKRSGVEICSDELQCKEVVETAVIHELIHAYDECHDANLEWGNSAHYACSEIRANRLSGECKDIEDEEGCVKMRSIIAMMLKHSPEEVDPAIEAVWGRCYNDTAPFDKPT